MRAAEGPLSISGDGRADTELNGRGGLQPELLSTKKSGAEAALAVVKSLMSLVELIGIETDDLLCAAVRRRWTARSRTRAATHLSGSEKRKSEDRTSWIFLPSTRAPTAQLLQ